MLRFRRKLNRCRPLHPPPLPAGEIALEHKLAAPHDDNGVNVALGPLFEKRVESGEAFGIEADLGGSRNDPSVVER
ncbi:hypothetical protein ACVMIH_002154 [Bradyrhizobium sp. USDA 4503]